MVRNVTKTEPTFTGTSLTTTSEHHYVPPPNLILEDFGDREDARLRPLVVSTPEVTFSSQNLDATFHVLASLSSTPDIDSSSSTTYIHISIEAFKKLVHWLEMIQELKQTSNTLSSNLSKELMISQ